MSDTELEKQIKVQYAAEILALIQDQKQLYGLELTERSENPPRFGSWAWPDVGRFEVIDESGRAYARGSIYGDPVKVELILQDGGRTLKVFVEAATLKSKQAEGKDA